MTPLITRKENKKIRELAKEERQRLVKQERNVKSKQSVAKKEKEAKEKEELKKKHLFDRCNKFSTFMNKLDVRERYDICFSYCFGSLLVIE